jgi:hypothetical protein
MLIAALWPINTAAARPRLQSKDGAQPEVDSVTTATQISDDAIWEPVDNKADLGKGSLSIRKGYSSVFFLNEGALRATLARAPEEFSQAAKDVRVEMMLPMPDGSFERFQIWESPIMEAPLAAEFPDVKTYIAQGIDDPTATVRFDLTPLGFHAQILAAGRSVYVDPYRAGDYTHYVSYDKRGLRRSGDFSCLVEEVERAADEIGEATDQKGVDNAAQSNGGTLRTYRLAQACTGEYAVAVCNNLGVSVTAANTMTAITTTINRVTGIYERDLSIRLTLVGNNTQVVYTNGSSDPYTNNNASSLLTENQSTCDSRIGSANYDIGHVFATGDGGLAGLGVVCVAGSKARAMTGRPSPWGDAFDVDYVAHEMGHQFGGNHTFNASTSGSCTSGNRNGSTAYEPGSGSTIQAYAGICSPENVQSNSDAYFHAISLREITNYVNSGSGTCSANTATGNTAPSVTLPSNYTVPFGTPFTLTASGSDANGDALTYCWEQWDLGTTSTTKPLFRSISPSTSPSRTFPAMSSVLAGSNSTTWETTPTVARSMKFVCTVRDNRAGGGGYAISGTSGTGGSVSYVTVTASGTSGTTFAVTSPNTAVSWAGNSSQTVTWSVGGSSSYCANVNILLSTNGGTTWTTVLAGTPNDGSQTITVPNTASTQCRVKVEGAGNIFFDVSNVNFTITSGGSTPAAPSGLSATAASSSQINLAWTDNSSNETGFKIERKTGASGTWSQITTTAAGVTSYSNTGLAASTQYYYRVRATNATGDSAYSNEANATTSSTGNTIAVNSSVNGSLATTDATTTAGNGSAGAYMDDYTFSAVSGTTYTITLNSTAFDAYLRLYNGSTLLTSDDDGNGGTNSKIVYTSTVTGTLTIRCTSYYAASTGAYTVSLTAPAGPPALTLGVSTSGSLATTDGTTTAGSGSGTAYKDDYSLSVVAGQQYTITLNSSAFDAYLRLYNGSTLLASNDDGNGGTNSRIVYTAASTGTLTVRCTSYYSGSTGAYTVLATNP